MEHSAVSREALMLELADMNPCSAESFGYAPIRRIFALSGSRKAATSLFCLETRENEHDYKDALSETNRQ